MIVYRQSFDLYHTIYRVAKILSMVSIDNPIEIDRIRIFDFFLQYPWELRHITLKKDENELRKLIRNDFPSNKNTYEKIINSRIFLEKMHTYHLTAIKCLASYGIIKKDYYLNSKIEVLSIKKLQLLLSQIDSNTENEEKTIVFLQKYFFKIPLFGPYGLKQKSKLLESKYDA